MKVYVVQSEDTQDRTPRVLSVHKTKKGAIKAQEEWNNRPIESSQGSTYPAKTFGAAATIKPMTLKV